MALQQKFQIIILVALIVLFIPISNFMMQKRKNQNFAPSNLGTGAVTHTNTNNGEYVFEDEPVILEENTVVQDIAANFKKIKIGNNELQDFAEITGTMIVPPDQSTEDGSLHPDTIQKIQDQLAKQGLKLELTRLD